MLTNYGGDLTHLRSLVEAVQDVGVVEMRVMIDGPDKTAAGALVPTGHCVHFPAWTTSSSTVGKCISHQGRTPRSQASTYIVPLSQLPHLLVMG